MTTCAYLPSILACRTLSITIFGARFLSYRAIERVTKTIEDRREELTDEQRAHAEAIIESATTSTGCAYFIDAPGGYGV